MDDYGTVKRSIATVRIHAGTRMAKVQSVQR